MDSEASSHSNGTDLSKRRSIRPRYSETGIRTSLYGQSRYSGNQTFRPRFSERIRYRMNVSTEEIMEQHSAHHWKKFLGCTWTMYKVAPLKNLQYYEVQLKQYAVYIKKELVNYVRDDSGDVQFIVQVSVLDNRKDTLTEPATLLIEVLVSKAEGEKRLKYKGILLPWDVDKELNLTFSPLLLCCGILSVSSIVHDALSYLFDTVIRPMQLSPEDLRWLAVLICDMTMKDSVKAKYYYKCPGIDEKEPIQIVIPCSIIKSLWDNIHEAESDEINYVQVEDFYKYLNSQLTRSFGIEFQALTLTKIQFPNASVSCDGRVKIHNVVTVAKVCSFLKQTAINLETPTPTLAATICE